MACRFNNSFPFVNFVLASSINEHYVDLNGKISRCENTIFQSHNKQNQRTNDHLQSMVVIVAEVTYVSPVNPKKSSSRLRVSNGTVVTHQGRELIIACAHKVFPLQNNKIYAYMKSDEDNHIPLEILSVCPEYDIAILQKLKDFEIDRVPLSISDCNQGADVSMIGYSEGVNESICRSRGRILAKKNICGRTFLLHNAIGTDKMCGSPIIYDGNIIGIYNHTLAWNDMQQLSPGYYGLLNILNNTGKQFRHINIPNWGLHMIPSEPQISNSYGNQSSPACQTVVSILKNSILDGNSSYDYDVSRLQDGDNILEIGGQTVCRDGLVNGIPIIEFLDSFVIRGKNPVITVMREGMRNTINTDIIGKMIRVPSDHERCHRDYVECLDATFTRLDSAIVFSLGHVFPHLWRYLDEDTLSTLFVIVVEAKKGSVFEPYIGSVVMSVNGLTVRRPIDIVKTHENSIKNGIQYLNIHVKPGGTLVTMLPTKPEEPTRLETRPETPPPPSSPPEAAKPPEVVEAPIDASFDAEENEFGALLTNDILGKF